MEEKSNQIKGKIIREKRASLHTRNSHIWDEEVTVKLNISPKKTIKLLTVVLIFVFVFYLGRWSVGDVAVAAVEAPEEESEGFFSSISGFFTFGDDDEVAETEATAELAEEETPAEEETTEEPAVEEEEEAVEEETTELEEEAEDIITTYNKVSLALKKPVIDWKGTWGKITKLEYTIKNSEDGTIKPSYFTMVVEGYEDFDKKVSLPPGSLSIPSLSAATSAATVSKGFAYSELTAGDLTNVKITLSLHDADGKLMADHIKEFDLSG